MKQKEEKKLKKKKNKDGDKLKEIMNTSSWNDSEQ